MTSFANIDYSTEHAGLARVQRGFGFIGSLVRGIDTNRGTASLLLGAIVAALLVVANQVIETWTEGHLLAAWIAMWTVAFAAIALFAAPAQEAAVGLRRTLRGWAAKRRQAESDRQLWNSALQDARVMADLSRAMSAESGRDVRGFY